MNLTDLTHLFTNFFPFGFVKVMILIILLIYIVFASIIVRQEHLMSRVVEIPFSPVLRLISLIHFVAAIGIFVLAFLLL